MGELKKRKKHKQPRKRNTGRTATILVRKQKRLRLLEINKHIIINGEKILKPQWRNEIPLREENHSS